MLNCPCNSLKPTLRLSLVTDTAAACGSCRQQRLCDPRTKRHVLNAASWCYIEHTQAVCLPHSLRHARRLDSPNTPLSTTHAHAKPTATRTPPCLSTCTCCKAICRTQPAMPHTILSSSQQQRCLAHASYTPDDATTAAALPRTPQLQHIASQPAGPHESPSRHPPGRITTATNHRIHRTNVPQP